MVECEAGHRCPEPCMWAPEPCAGGTYQGAARAERCEPCPAGSWSAAGAVSAGECTCTTRRALLHATGVFVDGPAVQGHRVL